MTSQMLVLTEPVTLHAQPVEDIVPIGAKAIVYEGLLLIFKLCHETVRYLANYLNVFIAVLLIG